jgi:hypothetical protein
MRIHMRDLVRMPPAVLEAHMTAPDLLADAIRDFAKRVHIEG